jgi:hypothetical protein
MANDDQQRNAADNDHAVGLKPEFRALSERAKELAKREERRRTEQMKADTQRKAESTKAEERRIAENRRQEEKKRAERRQESLRKEAERRIENGKAGVERNVCAVNSAARRRTGIKPRLPTQSRTRAMRLPRISGGAQQQRSPNASSVRKRNNRKSIAGRLTTCGRCTTGRCTASKKTRTRPSPDMLTRSRASTNGAAGAESAWRTP